MNVPFGLDEYVASDPETVGGEPCFIGTRVPLETVLDNLEAGHTIEEILENYPALRLEHIRSISLVVLKTKTQDFDDLLALAPAILDILPAIEPGTVIRLPAE